MKFLGGGNLAQKIHRDGPMTEDEAVGIMKELLSALSHAHLPGVVHRDIKPSNVLLTAEGRAKLVWCHGSHVGCGLAPTGLRQTVTPGLRLSLLPGL